MTPQGTTLVRSAAVLDIGRRLGGVWSLAARVAGVFPATWLDAAYNRIAAARERWFESPERACLTLPAHLRERFLASTEASR